MENLYFNENYVTSFELFNYIHDSEGYKINLSNKEMKLLESTKTFFTKTIIAKTFSIYDLKFIFSSCNEYVSKNLNKKIITLYDLKENLIASICSINIPAISEKLELNSINNSRLVLDVFDYFIFYKMLNINLLDSIKIMSSIYKVFKNKINLCTDSLINNRKIDYLYYFQFSNDNKIVNHDCIYNIKPSQEEVQRIKDIFNKQNEIEKDGYMFFSKLKQILFSFLKMDKIKNLFFQILNFIIFYINKFFNLLI